MANTPTHSRPPLHIDEAQVERACLRALQAVDRGSYSSPSPTSDELHVLSSTASAVGWMYVDLDRAVTELESVLSLQREDGSVPPLPGEPGVAVPLIASVFRMIYHSARMRLRRLEGRLAELVAPLDRFHRFLAGRDRRHLTVSEPRDERVLEPRTNAGPGHWSAAAQAPLFDVGVNALLVQAETDLADVAIHTGFPTRAIIARRTHRAQAIADRLWSEEQAAYCSRPLSGAAEPATLEGLLPLWGGAALAHHAKASVARYLGPGGELWAERGPASLAPGHPRFAEDQPGRGAVHPLLCWLAVRGLYRYGFEEVTARVNDALLGLAVEQGLYEGYAPRTGEGLGLLDPGVTAAVILDLVKTPYHVERW